MVDGSDDPTTATPVERTQPMPAPPEHMPELGRPSGWRGGQVAVVAVLALLLGGAGATLAWLAADGGEQEPIDAAGVPRTSTTSDAADRSTSSSTATSSVSTTTTRQSRNGGRSQSGGQTVVGNGVFTGSYQGNNDRSTDDFTVDDDWTIRWDVAEGIITIEVFDAADEVVETIQAQGQGELAVNEGGTYRLDIRTDGSRYNVAVTDGP